MLDFSKCPFFLDEEGMEYVKKTLDSLSLEEKVGQLLMPRCSALEPEERSLTMVREYAVGGVGMYTCAADKVREKVNFLQANSKVPMLIAANLESGGNGIAGEGTVFGCQLQTAATGDARFAFRLGDICGREGSAVGVNVSFAPIVDIDMNWRNPITNTRTFGSDADTVLSFAASYMDGLSGHDVASCVKHFPGDGVDERDQHLLSSVNSLSCEDWDKTYGRIYSSLIKKGTKTLMVGHILQPAYSKKLRPSLKDSELLPASLSYELTTLLLREKLGFNGVVFSDAADMAGLSCAMPRRHIPASVIKAGCDIYLFGRNFEEDRENLLEDARSGYLSRERLDEAVSRVLALKASLGLHRDRSIRTSPEVLGCAEHQRMADECADSAVTLVCDRQALLPIDPEKHKRVWLFILGDEPNFRFSRRCTADVVEQLSSCGFEVTLFDRNEPGEMLEPTEKLKEKYDLIIYVANIITASNKTVNRISWLSTQATDTPQFVQDIPTVFISLANPYHYIDVPMIKTQINGYTNSPAVINAVIRKMLGLSEFKGKSPVDPFCGLGEAR